MQMHIRHVCTIVHHSVLNKQTFFNFKNKHLHLAHNQSQFINSLKLETVSHPFIQPPYIPPYHTSIYICGNTYAAMPVTKNYQLYKMIERVWERQYECEWLSVCLSVSLTMFKLNQVLLHYICKLTLVFISSGITLHGTHNHTGTHSHTLYSSRFLCDTHSLHKKHLMQLIWFPFIFNIQHNTKETRYQTNK